MRCKLSLRALCLLAITAILVSADLARCQTSGSKRVFMVTDMEGVDGIFNMDDQCEPFRSPRWAESQKLLADEINAAIDGLYEGGATEVIVLDGHDGGRSLSVLTVHPRAPAGGTALSGLIRIGFFVLCHGVRWAACDGRGQEWCPEPHGK